jgi:hypothetical protein
MHGLSTDSTQPAQKKNTKTYKECPGIFVDWTPGDIWGSYPYHQHKVRVVGWQPVGFDSDSNKIQPRSDKCEEKIESYDELCPKIFVIPWSLEFKHFMERAHWDMAGIVWNKSAYILFAKIEFPKIYFRCAQTFLCPRKHSF